MTVVVDESNTVVIIQSAPANVIIQESPTKEIISVSAAGPSGPNAVGGFGFEIQELQAGDLLRFSGAAWENAAELNLTDGGNF